jgi:hypothetical protein
MTCEKAATSSKFGSENCPVKIASRQGFVVPKGVMRRKRAQRWTVILMVENSVIISTGK